MVAPISISSLPLLCVRQRKRERKEGWVLETVAHSDRSSSFSFLSFSLGGVDTYISPDGSSPTHTHTHTHRKRAKEKALSSMMGRGRGGGGRFVTLEKEIRSLSLSFFSLAHQIIYLGSPTGVLIP